MDLTLSGLVVSSRYSGLGLMHSVLVLLMLLTQKVQMFLFLLSRPVKVREVMMLQGAPRLESSDKPNYYKILPGYVRL